MGITGSNTKALTSSFFPRLNFHQYENFVVVPDSISLNFQVHILEYTCKYSVPRCGRPYSMRN